MHQPHRLHLAFDRLGNELFDLQRRGSGIAADQRRTFDDDVESSFLPSVTKPRAPPASRTKRKNQTTFLFFSEYSGRLMTVSL